VSVTDRVSKKLLPFKEKENNRPECTSFNRQAPKGGAKNTEK